MRVGLTLHYIRERKITGIERYGLTVANGVAQLGEDARAVDMHVLASRAAAGRVTTARRKVTRLAGDWRLFAEQTILPLWSRWERLDLLHVPAFGGAFVHTSPFVLNLHDAAFWDAPESLSFLGKHYYKGLVERSIRSRKLRATMYLSASGRDAVLRYFPQLRSSAFVCGAATELPFSDRPRCWGDRPDGPLKVLSVSTIEPRKNYPAMARVISRLSAILGRPVVWQIVGRRGWTTPEDEAALKLPEVQWFGFTSDDELARIYSSADVFLSLSRLEGFNIPMIEAMGLGTPAVVSDIPVHAEIAGDGAVRCAADDAEATARAIATLVGDETGWNDASRAAWQRARMYTPAALGKRLLDVYAFAK